MNLKINHKEIIVYTVLIGPNEGLNPQPQISKSKLRHVCLTDNKYLRSDDWEIIYVDKIFPQDPHRSQRNYKVRPHLIFKDYKFSLYIDNTVVLKTRTEDFIEKMIIENNLSEEQPFFVLPSHSSNNDLITEFNMCSRFDLDNQIRFYEQLNHYIKTNINYLKKRPFWAAIIFRNHSHNDIINLSEIWFAHICRYSRRDQLSLIHSSKQANVALLSIEINNNNSKFHKWPITINNKNNRVYEEKLTDLIPYNLLEDLLVKINHNEKLLSRIDYENRIKKKRMPIKILKLFFSRLKLILKNSLLFIAKRL